MKPKKEIAISKFKATCLAVLEEVRKTGRPVRVTRFGKPVADIVPPAPPENDGSWLGRMASHPDSPAILELVEGRDGPALDPGWREGWLKRWEEQLSDSGGPTAQTEKDDPGRAKRKSR